MRILLTNDDGIHAEGLAALERVAHLLSDDVWVVAPETDQSGLAHSLSLSEPLRLRQLGERRFALRGTPTDCVIMAIRQVLGSPPDLVLSGINAGSNVADDVTYSGTVAGAIEGTMNGIRSIALSQAYHVDAAGRAVPYEVAEAHASALIARLMKVDLPEGSFFNVNFPSCEPDAVDGIEVTTQGKLSFNLDVEERQDGRGLPYFWLRFGRRGGETAPGSDVDALRRNRISVTPLQLDMTDHKLMASLGRALSGGA